MKPHQMEAMKMGDLTVGVRELKAQLSEYLRRVKSGQTILITERGKPIGRIVPEEKSLEGRMQQLAKAGFVSWNGERLPPREPAVINPGPKLISDLVSEGRDVDYLP
jgi:prevent-host-death family protein